MNQKKKKIQLYGGLGNQLFIWSAAHALQYRFQNPVRLFYTRDKNSRLDRKIAVDQLLIFCSHEIDIAQDNYSGFKLRLIDWLAMKSRNIHFLFQKFYGVVDIDFSNIASSHSFFAKIIRGNFENNELVEAQHEILIQEIRCLLELKIDKLKKLHNFDFSQQYQAVHIRRGDRKFHTSHGNLSYHYYRKLIRGNYPLVILTDDDDEIDRISKELSPGAVIFGSEIDAWDALTIMAFSNVLTMANSTLSWWGGYFCQANGGEVDFPSPWAKNFQSTTEQLLMNRMNICQSEFE